MMKGDVGMFQPPPRLMVAAYSSILTKDILRIHRTGNAERLMRSRRLRMPRMMKGDVGMLQPPPRLMRVRLGAVDVEGLSLRLQSRVPPLPLLSTEEEGHAEKRMMMKEDAGVFPPLRPMRIRLGPVGTGDVEGLSLRLQSRAPLPLLSTEEEGNAG